MALTYPFETPARGAFTTVADGVHWMRLPLPYALDHINVYALDDGDGWAVVDTGSRTDEVTATWRELFAKAPDERPMTRVFVTHLHPDHVGMAGWLTRKFKVPLWMSRQEYLTCRVMVADTGREAPPEGAAFYHRAGWSEAAIETYRARFGNFGQHIHALPDQYHRLTDGQRLRIGGHDWVVVVGNGHSPEHACLYCADLKVLISGDQVLPRISSNVSVYPFEPDANPMAEWLASLERLQALIPNDTLVLPAHNEPFTGLHERLQALRDGQEVALSRLRRTLAQPSRTVDCFVALFGRAIGEGNDLQLSMATGEAQACLNHLGQRGEVVSDLDEHGVAWYRLV